MKISSLIGIKLIFISSFLYSQVENIKNYRYQTGKPYESFSSQYNYFNSEGEDIFSLKITGKNIKIQNYDAYLLTETVHSTYNDFPKEGVVIGVIKEGISYYLCYSLFQNNKTYFLTRKISFSKGELEAPLVTIEKEGITQFSVIESKEFKKTLVYSSSKKDTVNLYVFGPSLKFEWTKTIHGVTALSFMINTEGEVFYLSTKFDSLVENTKRNRDELTNYMTYCHKISIETDTKTRLEQLTGTPLSVIIKEDNKGQLICTGYNTQGIFYYLLNENTEVIHSSINDLPWSNNLYFKEVHLQEDGSSIIIGEQYHFYKDHLIDSDGEPYINYRNQYGYLLIIKISKNGALDWLKSIPKTQVSQSFNPDPLYKGSMSYKYLYLDKRHVFIYLDSRSNKDLPVQSSVKTYDVTKPAVLTSIAIDHETGLMKKSIIFDTKYVGNKQVYNFSNDKIVLVSPTSFVLEMYQKKKENILILVTKNK